MPITKHYFTGDDPDSAPQPLAPGATIGYARVSTTDQATALSHETQILAIELAYPNAAAIVIETASGADPARPGLRWAMASRPALLVVMRIDRLARSTLTILTILDDLATWRGVLRLLDIAIDPATPQGRLVITMLAAVAEFERTLIATRTSQGMMARGGKSHLSPSTRARILQLRAYGHSWRTTAKLISVESHRHIAQSTCRFICGQLSPCPIDKPSTH